MANEKVQKPVFNINVVGPSDDNNEFIIGADLETGSNPAIQVGQAVIMSKDGNLHFSGDLIVDGNVYADGSDTPVGPSTYVEANPEEEATADLLKIKINDTTYEIVGGADVEANVEITGSEDTLESLRINNDVYTIKTYQKFSNDWVTNGTTKAFFDSVNADVNAVEGMAFLGELTCSDLPTGIVNAETVVEITKSAVGGSKVIHLVVTSGNQAPYRWERTYWNNGHAMSGWISFMNTGEVQANPQGTSSTDLTKIQIGNNIYNIPQGGSSSYDGPKKFVVDLQDGWENFPQDVLNEISIGDIVIVSRSDMSYICGYCEDDKLEISYVYPFADNPNDYYEIYSEIHTYLYNSETELWEYSAEDSGENYITPTLANPELEGGEDTLESIQINGEKYIIPQGGDSSYMVKAWELGDGTPEELYNNQNMKPGDIIRLDTGVQQCVMKESFGAYFAAPMSPILMDSYLDARLEDSSDQSSYPMSQPELTETTCTATYVRSLPEDGQDPVVMHYRTASNQSKNSCGSPLGDAVSVPVMWFTDVCSYFCHIRHGLDIRLPLIAGKLYKYLHEHEIGTDVPVSVLLQSANNCMYPCWCMHIDPDVRLTFGYNFVKSGYNVIIVAVLMDALNNVYYQSVLNEGWFYWFDPDYIVISINADAIPILQSLERMAANSQVNEDILLAVTGTLKQLYPYDNGYAHFDKILSIQQLSAYITGDPTDPSSLVYAIDGVRPITPYNFMSGTWSPTYDPAGDPLLGNYDPTIVSRFSNAFNTTFQTINQPEE